MNSISNYLDFNVVCKFKSLLEVDDYPTIIQCNKNDEQFLQNNYALISVDCATGDVYCFEGSPGLTCDMASGREQYWELPKLADKKLVYDLLCKPAIIELLEEVYVGTEESNGYYYKDNSATVAFERLSMIFESYDNLCDLDYCSMEE